MISIRVFMATDEADVVALWQEVFPDAPATNDPLADIMRKQGMQPDLFLVAVVDERVIGTVMAGYDGHRGWLYYVAVRRAMQRQGVGRALVESAEERLWKLGCRKVNLQVREGNEQVVAFYQRRGYVVEPRVSMGKHLRGEDGF
ncbi:MAG: GNAT family acetyltransferase [Herpetosiphon sp.]